MKTINPSQNFHRKTKSDGTAYILLVKDLDNFNRPNKQTIRQTNQLFAHKVCRLSIKLSKTNSSNFKTSNTHFLIFPKISQNWQKHYNSEPKFLSIIKSSNLPIKFPGKFKTLDTHLQIALKNENPQDPLLNFSSRARNRGHPPPDFPGKLDPLSPDHIIDNPSQNIP